MRRAALALVVALLASVTFTTGGSSPSAAAFPETARIAGENRFATAVEISKGSFPSEAPAVVVATGRNFADALAGGALAVQLGAPILLVERNHVPDVVAAELTRLDPERVLLLGGEDALDGRVVTMVQQATGVAVERIAGATRYDTAAAVASLFPERPAAAYIATGINFPDALAGSAAAGVQSSPMLLVEPNNIPPSVVTQLQRLAPQQIVVLGGAGVVSDAVAGALGLIAPVSRIAGADRFATAALVASTVFPSAVGATLATGDGFADALAAGPAAARAASPVLLTPQWCAAQPVLDYLRARGWPGVVVVGGELVIGDRAESLWPCTPVPDGPVVPGIEFTHRSFAGPNAGFLLVVDRRVAGISLESTLPTASLRGRETTSSMARREGAVVAINGDFFTPDGRPVHAFARAGRLLLAPGLVENQYALDSTRADRWYLGTPELTQRLVVGDTTVPIARTNDGQPGAGEVGMFTPEANGNPAPPANACAARLHPVGAPAVDVTGASAQAHQVVAAACSPTPMAVGPGEVVLAAPMGDPNGAVLEGLAAGSSVTITWMLHPSWFGVTDTTGGNPLLVVNSRITDELATSTGGPYSERAPRTGIGFLPDGRMLLLAVDGRQSGYSVGMTLRQFAQAFIDLGAVGAINLDGGGSTSMVVDGVLANRPSDAGGERPVGTTLLVHDGRPRPVAATFAPALADPGDVGLPMELDAGSLGGYASARRASGEPMTPELDAAANAFESSDAPAGG